MHLMCYSFIASLSGSPSPSLSPLGSGLLPTYFSRNFPKIRPDWQQGSELSLMFPFFLILGYKKQSTHVSSFFQAGTRFPLHNNFCVDRSKLLVHFFNIQHASTQNFRCITPFCCHFISSYCFTLARSIPPVSICSMVIIDH
jgi:hypothetical protein